MARLYDLKDALKIKKIPEEDSGKYHTVSGMMMILLGKTPTKGDLTEWMGWSFEIMDMDGKKLIRFCVKKRGILFNGIRK